MNCFRAPVSLADAEAIIESCAGANWRDSFVLGLEVFLFVIAVFGLTIWMVKR